VPYTEFRGGQAVSETSYEYEDGVLVRSVTVSEPRWTDLDRGLLLALLAERADKCSECSHPMSLCRDPKRIGDWEVVQDICHPTLIAQVKAEELAKHKRRGVVLATRNKRR